ncbi:phage tail protein [Acinetobacter soli]|uniref:host specificity protein J n=1 Tax=Acinetobacter soli TaxID=487316 RepID=UPI00280FEB33|nr:phage tail protein [Acinetobacter soli]MDQ8995013.1 phage tail protein [Acinetobacter soli]
MNVKVKGAKKTSSSSRTPVVATDSAQSKTYIKILYGYAEGEIEGPVNGAQGIYLEDTPILDSNGNKNFESVSWDYRNGTNDQTYIEGFPEVSSETDVNVELKSTAWVRSLTNVEINAVRLRLKWGALRSTNASTGDVTGVTIRYAVDVSTDGAAYVEVLNTQISDKTSASYERSHRIDLPKSESGWNIRVRRLTPPTGTDYVTDQMYVASYAEVIDAKFRYPNTALLGLQYDAETFSSVAKVAIRARGTKIRVPSNYNPETRIYSGIWDGSFKRAYSNNPAWIYYDLCTAKRYGLGGRISTEMLDKASLYKLGQYCDGLVSDGAGGLEPRFTCNVYIQSADDAYTILSRLAGVFRAISYWDGDSIVCDADMPQDVFFNYTNANVIDGAFEYTGTRARDRHTVAKVAWDNPDNRFKTEYEFVRDQAAIAKHGVKVLQLDAWGCTSRGQAQRAGAWAIRSEQKDTQSVTFKVGLDGNIPLPGKVISVADNDYAGRFIGGRVSSISEDFKHITLDREITAKSGDTIYINSEAGEATSRIILSVSGREVIVGTPFDAQSVAAQNAWTIDSADLATRKFRVMSVKQDDSHQFTVTALEYNSSKFDEIDSGAATVNVPVSIINPVAQAAVTDIQIEAYDSVQQGLSVATMVISWTKADYAVKYLVEWRKDDGSWIKLPLTGNTSVEVQGIYAGSYTARVTAISAFDVASLATTSNLTILPGKQGNPPKVAFIKATGILFGMKLNWGFPAVGAMDTAHTEIQVSPNGNSNIAQLGLFAYPTSTHTIQGLQPNLTQFYQARLIDRIGNVGEWSDWTSATTSADASDVLDILSGKITESQLHQDLQHKIDKIDVIEGDLTVYDQRIQDASKAADAAIKAANKETEDRIAAIEKVEDGFTTKINKASEGIYNELNTYKKSTNEGFAAVANEIEVISNDQEQYAKKLNGVYAKVTPLTADQDSWTADSASNQASSWSIQSAQVDGDSALAQRIDVVNASVADANASIVEERTARVDQNSVMAQKISSLNADLDKKASAGALEQTNAKVEKLGDDYVAQTEKIDGVYAKVTPLTADQDTWTADSGSNQASSWSIQSAQVDGDSALSQRLDIVSTTVGENTATIKEVTESVDGLYVQKYIKLDVNGKVAGWGGANNGVESQFIFNFDSLAIGSGNSTGYYPFVFRTTPFTDPLTGTVFPVSAYLKSAMMDYQSVKTSHIEDLAVKTAKIDNLAVKTAKIDDLAVTGAKIDNLAVDTLKIKDNAVTVPVSAFAEASTSVGSDYTTVQTLAVPADMGHTILTFGAVFSFASYTSQQRLLCRVLKNGNIVFEDLEVHFIDYASVAVVSGSSGNHSHGLQINVTGTASDAGSHSHGYSGSTNSSTAGSGNTSHSHSYSGTTGSAGSHSHSLNLNASATSFNDGIHSHDVTIRGSARSAGTLNISRHDSTLIAGTFELQLRSDSGGSVNVSQRYIHAMTMRK